MDILIYCTVQYCTVLFHGHSTVQYKTSLERHVQTVGGPGAVAEVEGGLRHVRETRPGGGGGESRGKIVRTYTELREVRMCQGFCRRDSLFGIKQQHSLQQVPGLHVEVWQCGHHPLPRQ